MNEITRIVNAQITIIEKATDKDTERIIASQKDASENIANDLKKIYHADDVQVEIHDFVNGKTELPAEFTNQTMNRFEKVE